MGIDLVKKTEVSFETGQGVVMHGILVHLRRSGVVFEVYQPVSTLGSSAVLEKFRVTSREREVYLGRAVIVKLIEAGPATIAEATVEDRGWKDLSQDVDLHASLAEALSDAERDYSLDPDYKLVVADMHSLLSNLREWSDELELGWSRLEASERTRRQQDLRSTVEQTIIPRVNAYFERFEAIAGWLPPQHVPAHRDFMRRLLHPLVLCAPFPHRAYYKPLGYAGDYEMVSMMARNKPGGATVFAQAVDAWFLEQPPAEAHRNRIKVLVNHLNNEAVRTRNRGRPMRVFDVACGPAEEIRQFIDTHPISSDVQFSILDFNAETLAYAGSTIEKAARARSRTCRLEVIKKSVHQLIKESIRGGRSEYTGQFDFVYCAGLFDYLTDEVCRRLMNLMYDWLAPGGLLLASNVEPGNPLRHGMEHLLDWHLVYRNGADMLKLAPVAMDAEYQSCIEQTGFNVFLEVRKPE